MNTAAAYVLNADEIGTLETEVVDLVSKTCNFYNNNHKATSI